MKNESARKKILRTVFSVTGIIIVSKLAGFTKQLITAATFGTTIETDIISISEGLIGNVKFVIVQVLMTAFIPYYMRIKDSAEGEAQAFSTNVLLAVALATSLLSLGVTFLAGQIAAVIAPGYSEEFSASLTNYLRLFAPTLLLFGGMAVFHAVLDANKNFIPGQLEGLNQSIIQIALIFFLAARKGTDVLAIAFLVCALFNATLLGWWSRRHFGRPRLSMFKEPMMHEMAGMIVPLLIGYGLVYINQQVDKALASGLAYGTITALGYAATLSNLIGAIITAAASVLFPYITGDINRGRQNAAMDTAVYSALFMTLFFLPISILTVVCARDIVSCVYMHGAFSEQSVDKATCALAGYGLMFVPLVFREIFSRVQYAYHDSKHPMVSSSLSVFLNIALSVALCPRLGVFGITLASSVSVAFCGILNVVGARRCGGTLDGGKFLKNLPWLCMGSVACAGAGRLIASVLTRWNPLPRFALAALGGLIAYLPLVIPVLFALWRDRNHLVQSS